VSRTTDAILDGRTWGRSIVAARPAPDPFQGTNWYILRTVEFSGHTIRAQVVAGPFMRHEQAMTARTRMGGDLFISNNFQADGIKVVA